MSADVDGVTTKGDGRTAEREVPNIPAPDFNVLEAAPVPRSAAPVISFQMRVRDYSEREVYAIGLRSQIMIEARQREHDDATRERLLELFGEPERWGDTARGLLWAHCETFVGGFVASTRFELRVPVSLDLEVATVKYFTAIDSGKVPLAFHFNGTVFYCGDQDRLQITQVPWTAEAQFALPIETWRKTIDDHYPNGAFVRLEEDTLEALRRYRIARGLHSLDAALAELVMDARDRHGAQT
jgi:hypothetical protein